MFLIICLHGSRRADFLSFSPLCRTGIPGRIPRLPSHKCPRRFPRFFRPGHADDRPYCPPPAVLRRTKRKSGVTTPEFPLDHTPLSRRCTALRAMPRRPSGRCEGSFPHTLRAPRPRLRAGNASLVIQGFSSKSRVRPRAPWAACLRTWRRSLRCSPRPLSRVPCPR